MARSRANSESAHGMTTRSRSNSKADPPKNTTQYREIPPTIPESSDEELSEHSDSEFKDLEIAKIHEEKERLRRKEEEIKGKQRDEEKKKAQKEKQDQRQKEEREREDQRQREEEMKSKQRDDEKRKAQKEKQDQRQREEREKEDQKQREESKKQKERQKTNELVEKNNRISDTNGKIGKNRSEKTKTASSQAKSRKSLLESLIGKGKIEGLEKEKTEKLYQDTQATMETPDIDMEDASTREVDMVDNETEEESKPLTREPIVSSQEPPVIRDRIPPVIRNRVPIVTKSREPIVKREQVCDNACYDNASIVGWMSSRGSSKTYLIQYGALDYATYRIKPAHQVPLPFEPSNKNKIDNEKNRFGEKKNEDGKLIYTADNIVGLMAVAWQYNEAGEPEELLNPKNKKKKNHRFPVTYVLVQWSINNEFPETWETRSALRRRWHEFTDGAIYETACMTKDIHIEKYGSNPHQSSPSRTSKSPSSSSLRRGKAPSSRQSSSPQKNKGSAPVNSDIDSVLDLLGIDEDNIHKVKSNNLLPNDLKKEIIKEWNARKRSKDESDIESDIETEYESESEGDDD